MHTTERRSLILRELKKSGTIDVHSLAEKLGVSMMTIRNDLSFLSGKGMVVRTYGGAVLANQKEMIRLVSNVQKEQEKEKASIAREAVDLVSGGMYLFLDTGSTTYRMVPFLRELPITVVTNSLLAAREFSSNDTADLLMVGGNLSRYCMGFTGSVAQAQVEGLYCDLLFLGCAGISLEDDAIYCASSEEAGVKRAMISHARKVVLLSDATKQGKRGFVKFAELEEIDVMITDRLEEADMPLWKEKGVEVKLTS